MTKILVIEDETVLRESILQLLGFADFEAIGAENGAVGIQMIQELKPDIIICDVQMPGMGGFEVIRAVNENPEITHIPFIFLTATADENDIERGLALGAVAYITKPFAHNDLLNAINKCIS